MMGECRGCRWWDAANGPERSPRETWGACQLAYYDEQHDYNEVGEPVHPETRAYAYDAEYYCAGLYTAPDFGCNQYQAKEPDA